MLNYCVSAALPQPAWSFRKFYAELRTVIDAD